LDEIRSFVSIVNVRCNDKGKSLSELPLGSDRTYNSCESSEAGLFLTLTEKGVYHEANLSAQQAPSLFGTWFLEKNEHSSRKKSN